MVRIEILLIAGILAAPLVAAAADTRLPDAAMQGDRDAVRALILQHLDVNSAQGDGSTALHWAAEKDDVAMAKLLLDAGANPKAVSRLGNITPLFLASRAGDAAMIDLLLNAGASANAQNGTGTTPLMLAAASGSVDAAKALLDHGAEVNTKESTWGETALMFASALNRAPVVKLLLERGADARVTTNVASLDRTAIEENREKNANGRSDADAKKRAAMEYRGRGLQAMGGMTALLFAVRDGQMDTVRTLLAAGADVNEVSTADKTSPLTSAIFNGHYDMAMFLLNHGADPKLLNVDGLGPLYATIDMQFANRTWYPAADISEERTNYLDLMKALLAHGANPNDRIHKKLWFRRFHDDWIDAVGATPFWRAAQANDIAAMRLLVGAGADPAIPSTHKATPLIAAAGYGYEDQTSVVVPGARLAACKYLVEEVGADVNARDDKGYTPLHGAAYVGNNDLVNYLVARGGNVKARASLVLGRAQDTDTEVSDGSGDSVVDMANGPREHGMLHPDTIALLEKMGSVNSHNCRSSVCVLNTIPEKAGGGKQ